LSVAANAVSRLIARAYEDQFKLTVPQWRLMAVLGNEGAKTQQSLCSLTVMDKVTVMRAAQGLLKRRLVSRTPSTKDRRSHTLELSASGRVLYDKVVPLALKYEAQLVKDMAGADVKRLDMLLRRIELAAATRNAS
jgi:DNA-binding MarR family transcriptional regulator